MEKSPPRSNTSFSLTAAEMLKYGVSVRFDGEKPFFEAFEGQVTWYGRPDSEKIFYKPNSTEGSAEGEWIDRTELILRRPDFFEKQKPFLDKGFVKVYELHLKLLEEKK